MAKRSLPSRGQGQAWHDCVIMILVILLSLVAIFGIRLGGRPNKRRRDIRFGIDIRVVEAIFTPQGFEGKPTAEQMDAANRIINQRLDVGRSWTVM